MFTGILYLILKGWLGAPASLKEVHTLDVTVSWSPPQHTHTHTHSLILSRNPHMNNHVLHDSNTFKRVTISSTFPGTFPAIMLSFHPSFHPPIHLFVTVNVSIIISQYAPTFGCCAESRSEMLNKIHLGPRFHRVCSQQGGR